MCLLILHCFFEVINLVSSNLGNFFENEYTDKGNLCFLDGISFGIHRLMSDEKLSPSENDSPGKNYL